MVKVVQKFYNCYIEPYTLHPCCKKISWSRKELFKMKEVRSKMNICMHFGLRICYASERRDIKFPVLSENDYENGKGKVE